MIPCLRSDTGHRSAARGAFVAANGGGDLFEESVPFDRAATYRPDGGHGAELSDAEYTALAERGYLAVHEEGGTVKAVPHAVILPDAAVKAELLAVGGRVKRAHWDELCRLKAAYAEAVLSQTPPHLHAARRCCLQHIFFADPWLILHILKRLTESRKLHPPTPAQKKMLTTVIAADEG